MVSSALTDRSYRSSTDPASLRGASEDLFRAFAVGDQPIAWHCEHCVSPEQAAALAGPVESLDPELVSRFVRKTGTTWGDVDDLKRVVPRILALAADNRLSVSRTLVFEQLRKAGWTEWPKPQTDAIGRFLLAEFTRLLQCPPRPALVAHRWIGQVAAGTDDLSGFLTVWNDSIGPLPDPRVQASAVNHLVELLTSSALRPDLPDTMSDVFPHSEAAAEQLTAFLTGPGTHHDLRRVAAELANTPSSRRVNVAVERLRRFRTAVDRSDVHRIASR